MILSNAAICAACSSLNWAALFTLAVGLPAVSSASTARDWASVCPACGPTKMTWDCSTGMRADEGLVGGEHRRPERLVLEDGLHGEVVLWCRRGR